MSIRLFNTLTGIKEAFAPIDPPRVRMYVCGMTPKFDPHLGHAKLFVTMDVIRRYLGERGYDVRYVQNFTDVDDKIIARGLREGLPPEEVAAKYTDSYFRSMEALNVRAAQVYPKATETIPEIIEMIAELIQNGYAYAADGGDVFYSVASFASYGKLSHRTADDMQAGARIQVEPNKRDPRDFALWKGAKPQEPSWESPWGPGRPGWHIECSAMVRRWLGDQIDIHGGGPDLIFPHHENEIAQSEAYTGAEPFVRYWVHIGQLNVDNEKMAHSQENFTTVLEVIKEHEPAALRLYFLQQHYRHPVNFTWEALTAAERGLERLVRARERLRGFESFSVPTNGRPAQLPASVSSLEQRLATLRDDVRAALDDDINTALALSLLFDFARDVNGVFDGAPLSWTQEPTIVALAQRCGSAFDAHLATLGIVLPASRDMAGPHGTETGLSDEEIQRLVDERAALRRSRDFAGADTRRAQLEAHGIMLEDRPSGTLWRRSR
jgi:cysteinyl-tRNA synthetase